MTLPPKSNRRRFIAGAVCPSCGEQDKIVVFEEEQEQKMQCIHCNYQRSKEELNAEKNTESKIIRWPTRRDK